MLQRVTRCKKVSLAVNGAAPFSVTTPLFKFLTIPYEALNIRIMNITHTTIK